jgi:membrane protease YdiL (CAAX protease family)
MTEEAPSPRIRWYDLVIAFVGGNLLGAVLATILGIGVLLFAMQHGFHPTRQNLTVYMTKDFWANHAALVVTDIGFVAMTWLMARWRFARPLGHFFPPVPLVTILLAALSGFALSLALNGGNALLEYYRVMTFHNVDAELALVPHTPAEFAATIAVVAFFAPLVEEYFFRGLFFTWADAKWGAVAATLITGATFALVHGHLLIHPGLQGVLYTVELFIAGVVLARWVAGTGSLRTSFATHAAYNATAILFSVLVP